MGCQDFNGVLPLNCTVLSLCWNIFMGEAISSPPSNTGTFALMTMFNPGSVRRSMLKAESLHNCHQHSTGHVRSLLPALRSLPNFQKCIKCVFRGVNWLETTFSFLYPRSNRSRLHGTTEPYSNTGSLLCLSALGTRWTMNFFYQSSSSDVIYQDTSWQCLAIDSGMGLSGPVCGVLQIFHTCCQPTSMLYVVWIMNQRVGIPGDSTGEHECRSIGIKNQ